MSTHTSSGEDPKPALRQESPRVQSVPGISPNQMSGSSVRWEATARLLTPFDAQSETPTVRGPPSAATCTKRCNGPCRSGAPKSCSWLAVTTQAHACMDHCRDRFALGNVPARSSAQVSTTPTRQCLSAWAHAQRNRSGKHQGPGQASQRGKGSTRWMTPCAWLQIKGGPKAGGQRHQPAGGRPRDRPTTCATK